MNHVAAFILNLAAVSAQRALRWPCGEQDVYWTLRHAADAYSYGAS